MSSEVSSAVFWVLQHPQMGEGGAELARATNEWKTFSVCRAADEMAQTVS